METHGKIHGFTLAELMISMGLIAILLSAAVPGVSNTIKDKRLEGQLNAIVADIDLARSEAAKRHVPIIMCRSDAPNSAAPACGGSAQDWSTGYLVFTGEDGNNTYQAGSDTLLRRGQPALRGVRLRTSMTWSNNLEINPSGTLDEGCTAIMALCDDRGNAYGRQITIPLSGSPAMQANNIDSCTP